MNKEIRRGVTYWLVISLFIADILNPDIGLLKTMVFIGLCFLINEV